MENQDKLIDYKTIVAVVAGELWAKEAVIDHYADYIEKLSTEKVKQKDGSIKKVVNEELRQQIILKLLEEVANFKVQEKE